MEEMTLEPWMNDIQSGATICFTKSCVGEGKRGKYNRGVEMKQEGKSEG